MAIKMKTDVRYIIHDNAVVAIVKPTTVDKITQFVTTVFWNLNDEKLPKFPLPAEYKGVAKYKAGDKHDVEMAKAIARKKAMRSAYKAIKNYNTFLFDYFQKRMNEWEAHIASMSNQALQMTREIKSLTEDGDK